MYAQCTKFHSWVQPPSAFILGVLSLASTRRLGLQWDVLEKVTQTSFMGSGAKPPTSTIMSSRPSPFQSNVVSVCP